MTIKGVFFTRPPPPPYYLSHSDGTGSKLDSGRKRFSPRGNDWRNLMSYSEARSHFEKAKLNTVDKSAMEMLDGLKHLSHAIEDDLRPMEQSIRDNRDIQSSKQIPGSFT